mgnify:CR=1 FL=1
MKNRSILLGCLGAMLCITSMAQTTEDFPKKQKPWSVRMAESEMVRNPESWQVDFQPPVGAHIVRPSPCGERRDGIYGKVRYAG